MDLRLASRGLYFENRTKEAPSEMSSWIGLMSSKDPIDGGCGVARLRRHL